MYLLILKEPCLPHCEIAELERITDFTVGFDISLEELKNFAKMNDPVTTEIVF